MEDRKTKVAINGFGRTGRLTFRCLVDHPRLEVVGINDVADPENLAYLLRHDSVHPDPEVVIEAEDGHLRWGDRSVRMTHDEDPADLPWNDLGAEIVIEATGLFRERSKAARHLEAGADRVLVTAPGKGVDLTVCMGINEQKLDLDRHRVISNASCTTNAVAPVAKVLQDRFGIDSAFMTTVHAYTGSQSVVDSPSKKHRRGRAAAISTIPTSTGAAVALADVLPALKDKVDGIAMRVPVADGSLIDLVAHLETSTRPDEVNRAFRDASESLALTGILGITDAELISCDIVGMTLSALVDSHFTRVVGDRTVNVVAWYDNEWGYAQRVVDLASYVAEKTLEPAGPA